MYFVYYTKNADEDKTVINILKLFTTEVLTTVTKDYDELTFIQSDNSQLLAKGVNTWIREKNLR